ncbi:BnaCnng03270D [Brassica napus]|uniref:BnaCnng03270D protein n=1 Tax=Brassica napus TaxID=3708 RepID=A0A078FAI2_BRANA|nr:BnaCnng03270D [Brassica napus]
MTTMEQRRNQNTVQQQDDEETQHGPFPVEQLQAAGMASVDGLKQLSLSLPFSDMIPRCTVSWKSLRNLSLIECKLGQESTDNILSGCPVLESLTLYACRSLERLDLRKSLSLRRLEIYHSHPGRELDPSGPVEIVAPHIHFLKLTVYADKQFTLTDVSSLTEAHLYIRINILLDSTAHCFQTLALELLAKLHNVESLTLGATLLRILSLAELRGDPFPTLKVQTLIIRTETEFAQSVPGIARLLQNSPGLKKLTVYMMHGYNIMSRNLDQYWGLKYKVFAPSNDSYSMLGCNVATSKVLAWFMELVLRNAKTLENMVVWLRSRYFDDAQWFEEQLQIVGTLSHNNNVSILLKRKNF